MHYLRQFLPQSTGGTSPGDFFNVEAPLTIIGTDLLNDSISLGASSSYNASINGSLARTTDNIPGNWMSLESSLVITTGDGNDGVGGARLINEDSIDLGAGDDSITIMNGAYLTGGYTDGTPSLSDLNLSKLDGGEGSDTLYFGEDVDHGTILTLDIGNAVNFENLRGGNFDDTMIGDDNSNTLWGRSGSDTLYGHGGNDILYGGNGNNKLYGGSGDDILISDGNYPGDSSDVLDGGEGTDEITQAVAMIPLF